MIFDHIEKLKKQYTDKYVVVDESRPELKRFRGLTGTVKTVNMSGRALVEFDGYDNIGWYDIDPAFLKFVDAPLPKPRSQRRQEGGAEGREARRAESGEAGRRETGAAQPPSPRQRPPRASRSPRFSPPPASRPAQRRSPAAEAKLPPPRRPRSRRAARA